MESYIKDKKSLYNSILEFLKYQAMESYIKDKKSLYNSILEFLDDFDEYNDNDASKKSFEKLITIIKNQQIEEDAEEMRQFLEIIKNIGDHHHRYQEFNERISQLLLHYKTQIKQTLTNLEIFQIFKNNKKVVLFLIQNDIITISQEIYDEILNKIESNGTRYCHFFIPELEKFSGEKQMKNIKDKLLKEDSNIFTNYEEKRKTGENDSNICSLIREDSIDDFISHISRQNISPSSEIPPSIFETNQFLISQKNTSLIEYSAFFGSIQIFRYLRNKIDHLKPSLWIYAIHSNNAEIIYLLEEENFSPSINYVNCFIESIKCHHNNIAFYIKNNLLGSPKNEAEIVINSIRYHNYLYFKNDFIISYGFFYLHYYHYKKIVDLLLRQNDRLKFRDYSYQNIRNAANLNQVKSVYIYLSEKAEIPEKLFYKTKIKQIAIPSSISSIENSAFSECPSLEQISFSIPSFVTSIENSAFSKCSSLKIITIPSSVTSIKDFVFSDCSLLTRITFLKPSSLTSIGDFAFSRCPSLRQFTIPSSVISIGNHAFFGCSSLVQITIPSSVTSIENSTFSKCSSLRQITIPSSVTSIKNSAFFKCSSLRQITIPSSVTSIKNAAFSGCSSLIQITISSSVTEIGDSAFEECSSLTQIIIPSSVSSIKSNTFKKCSSLTQITIPSSVTSIGNYAFEGCSSLAQISIPSSVTKIGEGSFSFCSALTQITIPSSVTEVGKFAFRSTSSLAHITIPSSINTSQLELNENTVIEFIQC